MNAPLDARDLELLEKLVDAELAPFRKTGYVLIAGLPIGLAVALLEWNDARRSQYLPDSIWIALLIGFALFVAGAFIWRANRLGPQQPVHAALIEHRGRVTKIEAIRVVNSWADRLVIHTPVTKEPIRLIVHQRDREAVLKLLLRACPQANRLSDVSAADLPR
jgi:hypothetical protein